MFNLYSKLSMVFVAFAMIFSSSVSAQCTDYDNYNGTYGSYNMSTLVEGMETTVTSYAWAGEIFTLSNCVSGATYTINTCGNGAWDSFLEVFTEDGTCVAYNDDGDDCDYDWASSVSFESPVDGTLLLLISNYAGDETVGAEPSREAQALARVRDPLILPHLHGQGIASRPLF